MLPLTIGKCPKGTHSSKKGKVKKQGTYLAWWTLPLYNSTIQ